MKIYQYAILVFGTLTYTSFSPKNPPDIEFQVRILASGLSDPWSVVWGPEGSLWVNESKGYRVLKIDPTTGKKQIVLDLNAKREFRSFQELSKSKQPTPQGGLMGLALHPKLGKGKPYVYLSYVYKHVEGNKFLIRLVRYRYNADREQLDLPLVICDTIPASNDHNGGRMLIAPVSGKRYLFYTVGDQGSGQFSNGGIPNKAQQISSYEGKILRFNLEPKVGNNWVPADNPNPKSAVWTSGHRNPQGLAFALVNGIERLYSAEHGPYSDDEINLIEKGSNYGHPLVIGYPDGNYDGLAASVSDEKHYPGKWHSTYPLIHSEKQNADSIGAAYRPPVMSFFPNSSSQLLQLFKNIQLGQKVEWEAYAPSGIVVYDARGIPGWNQSLLVASLKTGKLLRLKLNSDGSVNPTIYEYAPSKARYRDVAVSPDGKTIYVATDSSAITSGPTIENPKAISQRGCILQLIPRKVAKP
jgi:PQQ-dependent dehydrogenase (s-GDH family)